MLSRALRRPPPLRARRPVLIVCVLAALALSATFAPAAPAAVLPGAAFCGFDVDIQNVVDTERARAIELADGSVLTRVTGRFVESYTNLVTHKTIIRDVSGPTTTTVGPDGITGTFVGDGASELIFGPTSRANTGEPALVVTHGRAVVSFTGNIVTGFALTGIQENICATLAAP